MNYKYLMFGSIMLAIFATLSYLSDGSFVDSRAYGANSITLMVMAMASKAGEK